MSKPVPYRRIGAFVYGPGVESEFGAEFEGEDVLLSVTPAPDSDGYVAPAELLVMPTDPDSIDTLIGFLQDVRKGLA